MISLDQKTSSLLLKSLIGMLLFGVMLVVIIGALCLK